MVKIIVGFEKCSLQCLLINFIYSETRGFDVEEKLIYQIIENAENKGNSTNPIIGWFHTKLHTKLQADGLNVP